MFVEIWRLFWRFLLTVESGKFTYLFASILLHPRKLGKKVTLVYLLCFDANWSSSKTWRKFCVHRPCQLTQLSLNFGSSEVCSGFFSSFFSIFTYLTSRRSSFFNFRFQVVKLWIFELTVKLNGPEWDWHSGAQDNIYGATCWRLGAHCWRFHHVWCLTEGMELTIFTGLNLMKWITAGDCWQKLKGKITSLMLLFWFMKMFVKISGRCLYAYNLSCCLSALPLIHMLSMILCVLKLFIFLPYVWTVKRTKWSFSSCFLSTFENFRKNRKLHESEAERTVINFQKPCERVRLLKSL